MNQEINILASRKISIPHLFGLQLIYYLIKLLFINCPLIPWENPSHYQFISDTDTPPTLKNLYNRLNYKHLTSFNLFSYFRASHSFSSSTESKSAEITFSIKLAKWLGLNTLRGKTRPDRVSQGESEKHRIDWNNKINSSRLLLLPQLIMKLCTFQPS